MSDRTPKRTVYRDFYQHRKTFLVATLGIVAAIGTVFMLSL